VPLPSSTPRFALLSKTVAIAAVLVALMLALGAVSGVVDERAGRLHEAEASVAASLASNQTILGPILQRDCVESWEVAQGEGKDRKTLTVVP
jgi:inner membrane protein